MRNFHALRRLIISFAIALICISLALCILQLKSMEVITGEPYIWCSLFMDVNKHKISVTGYGFNMLIDDYRIEPWRIVLEFILKIILSINRKHYTLSSENMVIHLSEIPTASIDVKEIENFLKSHGLYNTVINNVEKAYIIISLQIPNINVITDYNNKPPRIKRILLQSPWTAIAVKVPIIVNDTNINFDIQNITAYKPYNELEIHQEEDHVHVRCSVNTKKIPYPLTGELTITKSTAIKLRPLVNMLTLILVIFTIVFSILVIISYIKE